MIIYLHNWGWGRVLSAVRITIITTTILNESETLWKDLGGWVPSRAYRDPPLEGLCSAHQTLLCSSGSHSTTLARYEHKKKGSLDLVSYVP